MGWSGMSEPKTVPNSGDVTEFLDRIEDIQRRTDSRVLCDFMEKATGQRPILWGTAIVGFGSRHYRYESGREGDTVAVGFSPRKQALTLYGLLCAENNDLWSDLGKHSTGKGCLYIKRLSDVKMPTLGEAIKRAFAHNQT